MTKQDSIVAQFPLLKQQQDGKRLVYLDSGATSQRPQAVLDAVRAFYEEALKKISEV